MILFKLANVSVSQRERENSYTFVAQYTYYIILKHFLLHGKRKKLLASKFKCQKKHLLELLLSLNYSFDGEKRIFDLIDTYFFSNT